MASISAFAYANVPNPVIFVHGIGDSSVAWRSTGPVVSRHIKKYYDISDHSYFFSGSGICADRDDKDFSDNVHDLCVYVTFSDHFADPGKLAQELKKVIDDTRGEAWANYRFYFKSRDDVKVNLVCHSMGGLVARKYLADNIKDHHVSKLILIGTPNKGSSALMFDWVPAGLMVGGVSAFMLSGNPAFLSASVVGIGWDAISYSRGVKILSPAANAMKPGSKFLNDLNSKNMPTDVEYTVILCTANDLMHVTANRMLGYADGDGAVPLDSQSLKYAGIPNFSKLDYKEMKLIAPHFEEPTMAKDLVVEALGLKK